MQSSTVRISVKEKEEACAAARGGRHADSSCVVAADAADHHHQPSTAERPRYGTPWTVAQDQALTQAMQEGSTCKNWRKVAEVVPGAFTAVQCAQRWNKVLKPGLVKGRWSPQEDERLAQAVRGHDVSCTSNWAAVAREVPGRTVKQCRERWSFCLDPAVKRDDWTPVEEAKLLQLYALHGSNNWAAIAVEMEGRSPLAVKCHYHSMERHRRRAWTPAEDALLLDAKQRGLRGSTIAAELPNRSSYAIRARWSAMSTTSPATAVLTASPPRNASEAVRGDFPHSGYSDGDRSSPNPSSRIFQLEERARRLTINDGGAIDTQLPPSKRARGESIVISGEANKQRSSSSSSSSVEGGVHKVHHAHQVPNVHKLVRASSTTPTLGRVSPLSILVENHDEGMRFDLFRLSPIAFGTAKRSAGTDFPDTTAEEEEDIEGILAQL